MKYKRNNNGTIALLLKGYKKGLLAKRPVSKDEWNMYLAKCTCGKMAN